MIKEKNKQYKVLERLSYSPYDNDKYPIPSNFVKIDKYENPETGFYAEAYLNPKGEIYLVPRATQFLEINDLKNDYQLYKKQSPSQYGDLKYFYNTLLSKYGSNIKGCGYSLAGTLMAMLGNETGMDVVTFEAYGVGDFITPKHTENIINFGNEKDPIFIKNLDYQLGTTYVIPNEADALECYYGGEDLTNLLNMRYHFPNQIGNLDKAVEYKGSEKVLNGGISYFLNEDSLVPSNRLYYTGEVGNWNDLSEEERRVFMDQAFETGGLPAKEELEARSRMGELIYVESYVRSDGTKVSGYYRKCPR